MNAKTRCVRCAPAGASVIHPKGRRLVQWAGALAAAAMLAGCVPSGTKPTPELVAVVHNPTPPFSAGVFATKAPPHRLGDEIGFALTTNTTGVRAPVPAQRVGDGGGAGGERAGGGGGAGDVSIAGRSVQAASESAGGDRAGAVSGDAVAVCGVQRWGGGERAGDARARGGGVRDESERGDGGVCGG